MDKRGAVAAGAAAFVLFFVLIAVISSHFSTAVIDREEYILGERVKFDLSSYGNYTLKITTPSKSLIKQGSGDTFVFIPEELGSYYVRINYEGGIENYGFVVGNSSFIDDISDNVRANLDEGCRILKTSAEPSFTMNGESIAHFSPGENPIFIFNKTGQDGFFQRIVSFFYNDGEAVIYHGDKQEYIEALIKETDGGVNVSIKEKAGIRPGIYNLKVKLHGREYTREFAYGLLSVNTRKSIYKPGEMAEFEIVVLDSSGQGVCGAPIEMIITDPSNQNVFLSSFKGISSGSECGLYFSNFSTTGEGNYSVFLRSVVDKRVLVFKTGFTVSQNYEYEIVRRAESKIDPTKKDYFDVTINISSFDDVNSLNIEERVPSAFEIRSDASVFNDGDFKVLRWNISGKNGIVSYSYSPPKIWPYLYELGPLKVNGFIEARPWYVAVDPSSYGGCVGVIVCITEGGSIADCSCSQANADDGTYFGIAPGTKGLESKNNNRAQGGINMSNSSLVPNGATITRANLSLNYVVDNNIDSCVIYYSTNAGASWTTLVSDCRAHTTEATRSFDLSSLTETQLENLYLNWTILESGNTKLAFKMDFVNLTIAYNVAGAGTGPTITLNTQNGQSFSSRSVALNYTPISDASFRNCSLWDNSTGTFAFNMTNTTAIVNGTANYFNKNYSSDGNFLWNVRCCDTNNCTFAALNRTIFIDSTGPVVNLISPINGGNTSSVYGAELIYNTSDTLSTVANCSLFVNGSLKQTISSVTAGINQTFWQYLDNGWHNWSVRCSDSLGNIGWAANRSVYVNVTYNTMYATFYETSTQSYTSTATIRLNGSRDAVENTVAYSIPSGTLYTLVNATSSFMGFNGAVIPRGSVVDFSSIFTASNTQIKLTWKLSILNSSGVTLLCQNGNDGAGGESANSGTETGQNTTCINRDIYLKRSDQLLYTINGYNVHGSSQSITHAWDAAYDSYISVNVTTEGFLDVNLTSPASDPNIETAQTFNMSCSVSCSAGFCRNTNVYAQYNTSSSGWTNIGSSGNLVLATGETNPHNVGNLSISTVVTNFSIRGNIASVNNIRCVAASNYDSVNGSNTTRVTVIAAQSAPTVILTNPDNNWWFNYSTIVLYYNASDVNENIANTTLILNGLRNITNQSAVLNGQINNFTLTLVDGAYNWTVNVTDTTNYVGSASKRSFYIDTNFPNISLLYPNIDDVFYISTIQFNFSVIDNLDESLTCNLTIDGSVRHYNFQASNGSIVNRSVSDFSVGNHLWNVTCTDDAGNKNTSLTRNFSIIDLPPNVSLITAGNSYTNTGNITLIYNASDNNGFIRAILILNGLVNMTNQSAVVNGGYSNFSLVNLEEGVYNWTVNVSDTVGMNATAPMRNFTVDKTAPRINLSMPWNSSTYESSSVSFNFTAYDNFDGSLTCNLSVGGYNDNNFQASNGSLKNRDIPGLSDGLKIWNVTCWDDAGNFNVSENRVVNITIMPSVILNIYNNSYFNTSTVVLNYTPIDNTNLSRCSLYLNGVFNQSNGSAVRNNQINNFSITALEGTYTWYVECNDTINLRNQSETRQFTIDYTRPNINLLSPSPNASLLDPLIYFNFSVSDNIDTNLTCNLTANSIVIDAGFSAINGSNTSRGVSFSEGGFYIWNVTCWDDTGNRNTSLTSNFTLAFPPKVYLISPNTSFFWNSSTITLFYNTTDANDNIANATLILNGMRNMTNQSAVLNGDINNFTLTLDNGYYNWTVNVTDTTNLQATNLSVRSFVIDTYYPSVVLNKPGINDLLITNNITFNFSVSDNIDTDLTCNLTIGETSGDSVLFENIAVPNGSDIVRYVTRDDGTYNWTVECVDDSGNRNVSARYNFSIEAPPNVSLLEPIPGEYVNSTTITFIYLPQDAVGIKNCTLIIDGAINATDASPPIVRNQNNSFQVSGFNEGLHNWTVECIDAFPDYNVFVPNATNFTVDVTSPRVSIANPQNDTYNTESIPINFSINEAGYCNYSLNGGVTNVSMSANLSNTGFNATSSPVDGSYTLRAYCFDLAGNKNLSVKVVFSKDATAPNGTLITPGNDSYVNNRTQNLTVNATDNIGLANVTLFVYNSTNELVNQTTINANGLQAVLGVIYTFLYDGVFKWFYRIVDLAGNIFITGNNTITVDSIGPIASIVNPQNITYIISIIPFNFSLNEAGTCLYSLNSGVTNYTMTANASRTGFNATNSTMADGQYTLWAYCNDSAGNRNDSMSVSFSKDTVIPAVSIDNPQNITYNTTHINFNFSISEAGTCLYSLNGGITNNTMTANASRTGFNATNSTMADGQYTLWAYCNDSAGNRNDSMSVSFSKDTTPPWVVIVRPENTSYNTDYISFNFSLNEAGTCIYSLNGGVTNNTMSANASSTGFNATNSSIADGQYTVNAYCNDSIGNRNYTTSVTFVKDTISPLVSIVNPQNITYTIGSIPFNFSLNEPGTCLYSLNSGVTNYTMTANASRTGFNATNSTIADGSYTVNAYCNDTAGNRNDSVSVSFSKDATLPNGTLLTPLNDTYTNNATQNLTVNATDNIGLANVTLFVYNSTNEIVNQTTQSVYGVQSVAGIVYTFLYDGLFKWFYRIVDLAGNIFTTGNNTITIDRVNPYVTIVVPQNMTYITTFILFNFTLNEPGTCLYSLDNGVTNYTMTANASRTGFNATNSTIADGSYTVNAYCNDSAGNRNDSVSVSFSKDTVIPAVSIDNPQNITYNTTYIDFNFSINEAGTCLYSLNGGITNNTMTANASRTGFNATNSSIADGQYTLWAYCNDSAGNRNDSASILFIKDATIPNGTLLTPGNGSYVNSSVQNLTVNATDNIGLANVTLFVYNSTNELVNQTTQSVYGMQSVAGIVYTFLYDGLFKWFYRIVDTAGNFFVTVNNTLTVDTRFPNIVLNIPFNGSNNLRAIFFNFTSDDNMDMILNCSLYIDGVANLSNINLSNGSSVSLGVGGFGLGWHFWNVSCIDDAGNRNWSVTWGFNVTLPDLSVNVSDIVFNTSNPKENESVRINATVRNLANVSIRNITVQFFNGNPDAGGTRIGLNQTIVLLNGLGESVVSVDWYANLGTSYIFVLVDPPTAINGSIEEINESNNLANKSISVSGWHFVYGNITGESKLELADGNNSEVIAWDLSAYNNTNVFVTDYESDVQWRSLQALGRNVTGANASNDFGEIDAILGMTNFSDSITALYTTGGEASNTMSFVVFHRNITNVSIANSTNNTNFVTGILWDMSNDSDGEYGVADRENVVFITKVNINKAGAYGIYDYEIRVPAKLRDYIAVDRREAAFYVEIY